MGLLLISEAQTAVNFMNFKPATMTHAHFRHYISYVLCQNKVHLFLVTHYLNMRSSVLHHLLNLHGIRKRHIIAEELSSEHLIVLRRPHAL